jgi:hypothetical protein
MGVFVAGAPGVYLRGLASPPAVQLSAVAGFVGTAERGPLHRPQAIRSRDEYLAVFGDRVGYAILPDVVFGFYRNGGGKCYVVRAADIADHSADNPAGGCPRVDVLRAAQFVVKDVNGHPTIGIAAINEGRWGNRLQVPPAVPGSRRNMLLTTLASAAARGDSFVSVVDSADFAPNMAIQLAPPANPFAAIAATVSAVDGSKLRLALPLAAPLVAGTMVLGQGFKLTVRLDQQVEVFDDLSLSPVNARYFVSTINGPDDLPYLERQAQGYSILVRALRPGPAQPEQAAGGDGAHYGSATVSDDHSTAISFVARAGSKDARTFGSAGNHIRLHAVPFATRMALPATARSDRFVVEDIRGFNAGDTASIVTDSGSDSVSVVSAQTDHQILIAGPDGLRRDYPVGTTVTIPNRFTLRVFVGDAREPVAIYPNLSGDPAVADRYFRTVLGNDDAGLLCAEAPNAVFRSLNFDATLAGGSDPGSIDSHWYTGYEGSDYFVPPRSPPATRYGLATLEDVEDVDLVAIPDLVWQQPADPSTDPPHLEAAYLAAQRQVLYHAAKCGDRLALLDTPRDYGPKQVLALVPQLATPSTASAGALYYPWLRTAAGGIERVLPPSGLVAGVIARADRARGVARAPANEPILDAVDLAAPVEADQDALNAAGVNCARKLEGPGIELWGARTLSSDPTARYVNMRRLIIALKKALGNTLQWAVFEPNGPELRRRVAAAITSLMRTLVAGGATASASENDAFFVQCDEGNNPPESVAAGQIVATVGVALLAPAEFILLNIRRTSDSVNVTEQIG